VTRDSAAPAPARSDVPVDTSLAGSDFLASLPKGAHVTRTTVTRRIEFKVGPGGKMSIAVDGTHYEHIDDVPDAAIRDEVRAILRSLPATVTDPANRARVEAELRAAGIDPTS